MGLLIWVLLIFVVPISIGVLISRYRGCWRARVEKSNSQLNKEQPLHIENREDYYFLEFLELAYKRLGKLDNAICDKQRKYGDELRDKIKKLYFTLSTLIVNINEDNYRNPGIVPLFCSQLIELQEVLDNYEELTSQVAYDKVKTTLTMLDATAKKIKYNLEKPQNDDLIDKVDVLHKNTGGTLGYYTEKRYKRFNEHYRVVLHNKTNRNNNSSEKYGNFIWKF